MRNVHKTEPFKSRRHAERWMQGEGMVKESSNKWRHPASGNVRWIDSQNRIVYSYGK
jgi:hypothetical protein